MTKRGDQEERLAKLRTEMEECVERTAERNPEYAERLRAQLDSLQPALDELQDMILDAQNMGDPPEDDETEGADEPPESDEQ